jgi:SAM-dependent methyltransferase
MWTDYARVGARVGYSPFVAVAKSLEAENDGGTDVHLEVFTMTASAGVIDYEEHWSNSVATYSNHPTSRHRRRFVMERLDRIKPRPGMFVFDYGSGPGLLLEQIKSAYALRDDDLGGCDISYTGINKARQRLRGGNFFVGEYPQLKRHIDIAITSEVIEHTAEYREVLRWMSAHLKPGGHLIITTPGGTMDPPDEYYGHIQHFTLPQLTGILDELGFTVKVARHWGFPLFSLQKWVTKRNFDTIRERYMHGELDWKKRAIFKATYYAYFLHDILSMGPQIFIHAQKKTA